MLRVTKMVSRRLFHTYAFFEPPPHKKTGYLLQWLLLVVVPCTTMFLNDNYFKIYIYIYSKLAS